MCKCVTSKCCMVHFEVDLEITQQAILPEEANYCCAIEIILVFAWFTGFRLDEESSFEALGPCIIFCFMKEGCEVLGLSFHIGVEQAHVPFTSSPENIIFTAKRDSSVQRCFYLRTRVSKHMEIRIRSRPIHIPAIGEEVSSSP